MQSELLGALGARRSKIHTRWDELLHIEPVNTPLAQPEALAHLIDWTMEEIFRALASHKEPRRWREHNSLGPPHRSLCACGRNPLLAYFDAADQAMREALILVQAAVAPLDPMERDASLEELNAVLHQIARHEIEAFCGVCQYRQKPEEHAHCPAMAGHAAP